MLFLLKLVEISYISLDYSLCLEQMVVLGSLDSLTLMIYHRVNFFILNSIFFLFSFIDYHYLWYIVIYIFCIICIYSSTWIFPFSLYLSSLSANNAWIYWAWFSMSSWIIFCRSSDILNIFPVVYVLYSLLACKIVVLISANCVFTTFSNLAIFWSYIWMLAIVSIPCMILWYFFIQSFLLLFKTVIKLGLLIVQVTYWLGKVGVVVNC